MKTQLITAAVLIALTQASCATVAMAAAPSVLKSVTTTKNAAPADKAKSDKRQIFKGAGIGCAVGAGLSVLLGKKDDLLKGCAVGAVAGGVIAYQKQLKDARELVAEANASGMNAIVKTREVTDKDGTKGEALNSLSIRYAPEDMHPLNQKTSATLDKLAALGKNAKNTLTFTFEGKRNCEVPLRELEKRGAFVRHTVVNRCGKGENQILITPVPEV